MANGSVVYTPETFGQNFADLKARDNISGLTVHPDSGDLTNEAVFRSVRKTGSFVWDALGYLDILDGNQQTIMRGVAEVNFEVFVLKHELAQVRQELSSVRQSLETISSFLGVVIPDWQTQEEVERGDDMGIARPSAAELGLQVNFNFDQANPAFNHGQVESINPPAGTLVARGSTITVTVNLEG